VKRLRFALDAIVAIAGLAVAVALVFASHHESHPWRTSVASGAAFVSFVAAGLIGLWRRPGSGTAFYLTATGYLWFLGALTESNNAWVWSTGFLLQNLALVAFAAFIVAYPEGQIDRKGVWLLAVGGGAAIVGNLLGLLLDAAIQTGDGSANRCGVTPDHKRAVTVPSALKGPGGRLRAPQQRTTGCQPKGNLVAQGADR
jgi:hypothetical protein